MANARVYGPEDRWVKCRLDPKTRSALAEVARANDRSVIREMSHAIKTHVRKHQQLITT